MKIFKSIYKKLKGSKKKDEKTNTDKTSDPNKDITLPVNSSSVLRDHNDNEDEHEENEDEIDYTAQIIAKGGEEELVSNKGTPNLRKAMNGNEDAKQEDPDTNYIVANLAGGSDAGSEIGSKAPSQAKSSPSSRPGGPYDDSKPPDTGSKAGSVMSGTSLAKDKANGLELNDNGGFGLLTKEDLLRVSQVFKTIARETTNSKGVKSYRVDREQFGMAASMIGLKKIEAQIHEMFSRTGDGLEMADLLDENQFIRRVNCFRLDNISVEQQENIINWFNSMYEIFVPDDSQIDSKGERYLLVKQLKIVLMDYGHKVQAEEADQIIRECKPLPDEDSRFDESIARIYFGQYLAMLVDESLV